MAENEQEKAGVKSAKLSDAEEPLSESPKDSQKEESHNSETESVPVGTASVQADSTSPQVEDEVNAEPTSSENAIGPVDSEGQQEPQTEEAVKPTDKSDEESKDKEDSAETDQQEDAVDIKASKENDKETAEAADEAEITDIPVDDSSQSVEPDQGIDKTEVQSNENDAPASEEPKGEPEAVKEESHEEAHLDYTEYNKKQMVQVLESLLKEDDFSQVGRILKEIKKPFDRIVSGERKKAFDAYIADGGEKDGFEYRSDELDNRFNTAYDKLKERRNQYFNSLEKQKESNLNIKLDLLEKLRELVDSEETGSSIKALKEIQAKWKEVGNIPSSQVKGLWANYNALMDRFYDQRTIYFELKELDRKKNYDLKIDICERAESLVEQENIREVIKHLNELHDEFKHIGPVPKEEQEKIWDRFKAASDKIYARRKEFFDKLKDELKLNEVAKEALVEKVIPFADFKSDRISDWNAKTKEILAIQKEWEKIGAMPKEKAKLINKKFWSSFKSFFSKKGQFFKKVDEDRKANLEQKLKLVEQAEELKESEDFKETSEKLKALQRQWKEIGAVPEKHRNDVFFKFKKACDHFFDRRRSNSGKIEKDYEENLEKKKSLCDELEKMISGKKVDLDRVKEIEKEWSQVGFVPKSSIKSIMKRHTEVINALTEQADLPEGEKHKMRFSAQFSNMNYGPGSEQLLHKKEGALRRQISNLENDINLWKNNIDFFASSKNADKLKADFQEKINKAAEELNGLKEQLKVISNI